MRELLEALHREPPEVCNEGTAVAFDLLPRDRVALARRLMRRNGVRSVSILDLWQQTIQLPDEVMYPVAGAFVERLATVGGNELLLRLLKTQTLADARTIYGAGLDKIVAELEVQLSRDLSDPQIELDRRLVDALQVVRQPQ